MGSGFLEDLRYFGPRLGPGRGIELARRKLAKAFRKRRLARVLAVEDSDQALYARLGLPADASARLARLRETWAPLADSPRLAPRLSEEDARECAGNVPAGETLAEAVLQGRQILFGQSLTVGWPPRWDWRWDGTENAPVFARDVRSTWELQRLQGILPLAAASRGASPAGNERFASAYLHALQEFDRTNPGPGGTAWASALELGLRLVALTQGLPQISNGDAFASQATRVLRLLDRHARWLAADLSLDKVVAGNHLLGELSGLLAAGCLLPSARPAWWGSKDVRHLLEAEILRQFHPDGVNAEQSLTYEAFILEFLVVAGEAAHIRGEPFSEPVRARLLAVARHLEAATLPGGDLPHVGDCDSGRGAWFGVPDPHRPCVGILRARTVFGNPQAGEPRESHAPGGDGDSPQVTPQCS